NYVGSVGRHLFIQPVANTARFPGPGPIQPRQPFPQYGGTFSNSTNIGNSSYNSLQARIENRQFHGLSFLGSYTWSKALDIQSSGQVRDHGNRSADSLRAPGSRRLVSRARRLVRGVTVSSGPYGHKARKPATATAGRARWE